ncbi:hypothetical protein [Actinoalloteichus hymeniacidonis]|uniref:hypothetical protein n=1 Tax=Actinoalloteichus hymeniacidonis TaxID=340345 RepID=UPI000852C151|nr:hypothetical protein [Actinoalloteichus hymeniacidonis]MBB5908969.1 hypothetical protein [Actinoalloteichus hymeniacidonis]
MPCPSATIVTWTSAWLRGAAAADDVLDALRVWAQAHEVRAADQHTAAIADLPGPDEQAVAPAMLLATLRRFPATTARLVLPVAGDVRGLGGPGRFAEDALRVGEAALFPEAGLALVPDIGPEGLMWWTVHTLPEMMPPVEYHPIGEAEHGLAAAMRQAATALTELGVARRRPGVREEIAEALASRPMPDWPEGMPQRALRVLERAAEVAAILDVAGRDAPGGALSASAARARDEALRPIKAAVRAARMTAVDDAARILSERAEKH